MEIQLWRSILCPYELAVKELTVKFEHIISEHRENDLYSPIEQVSGRVKSVSSILEKMQRKHIPMERMEEEVEDIAGIRIICQFEEDIETVASLIQNRSDMTIKSEKNYLKHVKQSGYRSLHLIIYYTVETLNGPRRLQAEIQIRTMAMDFWATIEHSLQYKYKGDMPPHVAERLTNAADAIILLDQEMSSVRNEIMDAQNSSQMQSNLVKDILNNIENLYRVSSEREVIKIQTEFLRVFHTKDLSAQIGAARLSFAKPEYMEKFLDITPGSVSVLGLMNDTGHHVQLLIDEDVLNSEFVGCHPCINTSSLRLRTKDLIEKILPAVEHDFIRVKL